MLQVSLPLNVCPFLLLSLCIAEIMLRCFLRRLQIDMLRKFSVTLYETSFIQIDSLGILSKTKGRKLLFVSLH